MASQILSISAFRSHPLSIVPSRGNLEQKLGKRELGNGAIAKCHLGDIFSYRNKLYFHSICRAYILCAVNKVMKCHEGAQTSFVCVLLQKTP